MPESKYIPGLTFRSFFACVLTMLLMSMLIQAGEVIMSQALWAEPVLPIHAMWVIIAMSLVIGGVCAATRVRILNRAEMLCVVFAMLIAAPLCTQGFWHRILNGLSSFPRYGNFQTADLLNDKLWPHGPNIVGQALDEDGDKAIPRSLIGSVKWEDAEYDEGQPARLPVLSNADDTMLSSIRLKFDLKQTDSPIVPGEPYMVTALFRGEGFTYDSFYFCRVYYDGDPTFSEFFRGAKEEQVTYYRKTGFIRSGAWAVEFSKQATETVELEFGLSGPGKLLIADPKLFNVDSMESLWTSKRIVTRSEFDALPTGERGGLIVRPDNLRSFAGLKFLLSGYIPMREWLTPFLAWTTFILLMLVPVLIVTVIMRKQWMDSERYQMPMTRIPLALIGEDEEDDKRAFPAIWRNRYMWAGFAVGLLWCLAKGWRYYNPSVPNLNINIPLAPYFRNPAWGGMWNSLNITVYALFLSIAMFMELGILASIIVGTFLVKAELFVGYQLDLDTIRGYPFEHQQAIGAYLMYALIVIVFSRKYLWRVIKAAFRNDRKASEGELFSYRTAFILLTASVACAVLWANWMDMSAFGVLVFLLILFAHGFVSAKLRAECGLPIGYFVAWSIAIVMVHTGGCDVFGTRVIFFAFIVSWFVGYTPFFLIPGAQLELMELGRRFRIKPGHILCTCLLGLFGGMLFGGWVFLSNAYSMRGETSTLAGTYCFREIYWFFSDAIRDLGTTTDSMLGTETGAVQTPPAVWAYVFGAVVMLVLAVLRQTFAGFWFHPVGYIVGTTAIGWAYIWGSCIFALVIRSATVWLGGAATVRKKLQPFFVGVFLGAMISAAVFAVYAGYLRSIDIGMTYSELP